MEELSADEVRLLCMLFIHFCTFPVERARKLTVFSGSIM